ncbi:GNAT family N-acetyltransferase [Phototrophicus methaneseepsis]|uniref:GNAT family N-acetyltransferase n=1 Tax=Phototrophicus methaneseepsis TaxID=2710758 RepID=A0A7S8EBQ2_9CHLR|nr:GNAT family protein [Phototrophicus methaneseepsis]QPC83979.1 GNAT family N-acetyltransferase [Phototrophicus methaneseepsis]
MTIFSPIFAGKLVRLAPPQPEDMPIVASWTHDDDYMRNLDDDPIRPMSVEQIAQQPQHGDYGFHIRTLEQDLLIGFVSLFNLKWRNQTAELAIGIGNPDYRGRGYGSDALRLILRYGFDELNLHHIALTVMDYNSSAIRAYERVGFIKEGARREFIVRNGQRYDLLMYGMLRDEWLATLES